MSSGILWFQKIEVVAGLVLPILATLITSLRLFERMRRHRLWLDDACAALAMICMIIFCVVNFLYMHNYSLYPQMTRVSLYYTTAQFFYAVLWASRISMLFTIIRMTIQGTYRRVLSYLVVAFLVTWMVLFAQVFWTCEREPGWKMQPRPQCNLGKDVVIAQIITDVIGDTILILAPFRLVYRVKLSRSQKIRILSIFSTSAVTTVVSLVHAYYILSYAVLKEALAAMIEISVSLIVANLSVVVAFVFRISTEESSTFTQTQFTSIITLGSQLIGNRAQKKTLIEAGTTTVILGDFNTCPHGTETEFEPIREQDVESVTLHNDPQAKPVISG